MTRSTQVGACEAQSASGYCMRETYRSYGQRGSGAQEKKRPVKRTYVPWYWSTFRIDSCRGPSVAQGSRVRQRSCLLSASCEKCSRLTSMCGTLKAESVHSWMGKCADGVPHPSVSTESADESTSLGSSPDGHDQTRIPVPFDPKLLSIAIVLPAPASVASLEAYGCKSTRHPSVLSAVVEQLSVSSRPVCVTLGRLQVDLVWIMEAPRGKSVFVFSQMSISS